MLKKLILTVIMLYLLSIPVMAEEAQSIEIQWAKFGINLSGDTVYLMKSHKIVAGLGISPVTFLDDKLDLRIEYTNDMQGDMFSNDLMGISLMGDIVKLSKLIPGSQWSLPDIGVKLGIGYMDDIEKFDFKNGEPVLILQVIKLF